MPDLIEKRYLGDAVYAVVENGMIRLTTEDGPGPEPTNTIYLEVEVYQALVAFCEDARAATQALSEEPHPPDCLCDPCTCSRCGKHIHDGKCA